MSNLTTLALFTDVNFNINLFLHFLILFSFLSIFFVLIISKASTLAFNNEVERLIGELLHNKIDELKKKSDEFDQITNILPLNKLYNEYQKGNLLVNQHNNNLIKIIIIINVFLWMFFVASLILLNNCNSHIDIKEIILENIIIFGCVGIVEYYFFTRIAIKFVPVEPSFISKQFLESLKNKLQKN